MSSESNQTAGYQAACELAIERFSAAYPAALAQRARAEYDQATTSLRFVYLGRMYRVEWPSGKTTEDASGAEPPLHVRVLLLNYALDAHPGLTGGEPIAFRDIPGAATYEPSFVKRAVTPLVRTFDGRPDALYAAAEALGGTRAEVADASVRIPVLPLLEITYGVWHGDEEFPASGVILFDPSARRMLSIECMVVAAASGTYELIRRAR